MHPVPHLPSWPGGVLSWALCLHLAHPRLQGGRNSGGWESGRVGGQAGEPRGLLRPAPPEGEEGPRGPG